MCFFVLLAVHFRSVYCFYGDLIFCNFVLCLRLVFLTCLKESAQSLYLVSFSLSGSGKKFIFSFHFLFMLSTLQNFKFCFIKSEKHAKAVHDYEMILTVLNNGLFFYWCDKSGSMNKNEE